MNMAQPLNHPRGPIINVKERGLMFISFSPAHLQPSLGEKKILKKKLVLKV